MNSLCFCLFFVIGSVRLNPLLLPALPAPVRSPILLPPVSFNLDANHALAISRQNSVLHADQSVSLDITSPLVRPLAFFNNRLASVVSTLPNFIAARRAVLGTAIASGRQLVQATGVKAAQAQQNIHNNVLQAGQRILRPIALIPSRLISGLRSRISLSQTASVPALPLPALKSIQSPLVAPVKSPMAFGNGFLKF